MTQATSFRKWRRDQAGFWRQSAEIVTEEQPSPLAGASVLGGFTVGLDGAQSVKLFYAASPSDRKAEIASQLPAEAWQIGDEDFAVQPTGRLEFHEPTEAALPQDAEPSAPAALISDSDMSAMTALANGMAAVEKAAIAKKATKKGGKK